MIEALDAHELKCDLAADVIAPSIAAATFAWPHELKCDMAVDVIRRFGTLRLRVNGFSMLPSIWPGDVACVSGVDRDAYRPGDVVLYARNGRLFVHRLVEIVGDTEVTRGDALLDTDPPVRAGDLLGRVVSIERGGSSIDLPRGKLWAEGRWGGAGAVGAAGA